METLLFYGLLVLIGVALLRAILPERSAPPQVIYVQAESAPADEGNGWGCLPLLVLGGVVLAALALGG